MGIQIGAGTIFWAACVAFGVGVGVWTFAPFKPSQTRVAALGLVATGLLAMMAVAVWSHWL